MQPRLTVSDLACRRGDRLLFKGLSFELGAGEALQVVGANGTGKSSLLRILAGLLRPFAGTVERREPVALLDHHLPLDEHLPLGKALDRYRDMIGGCGPAQREFLGLTELRDVPVRYLSTGQRKRTAYMLSNPYCAPIWLLDEPLNGLDADWAERLLEELEGHRATDGLIVVASHQPFPLGNLRTLDLAEFAA